MVPGVPRGMICMVQDSRCLPTCLQAKYQVPGTVYDTPPVGTRAVIVPGTGTETKISYSHPEF